MPSKPTGRPRGRPPGAKNIPKLEAFVAESIVAPPIIVPVEPRKAPRGPCVGMTPEQRTAYFKALVARRKTHRGGHPRGVPRNMTVAQHEAHQAAQQPIIARIIKKMAANEQLPDDPMAVEALKEAMTVLRSTIPPRDKIAAARLILDFTKSKPTAKVEHTVKTAEDLLDEMAEE
jgi:hypothetical protein